MNNYKIVSYSTKSVTIRNEDTDERIEVELTPEESKLMYEEGFGCYMSDTPEYNVHRHYHGMYNIMKEIVNSEEYENQHVMYDYEDAVRIYNDNMNNIEKDGRPPIETVHVDDDWHTSSEVYIIPHCSDWQWMGVTVEYVPQCTGEQPIRFFLYPHALDKMIEALQRMKNLSEQVGYRYNESPSGKRETEIREQIKDRAIKTLKLEEDQ